MTIKQNKRHHNPYVNENLLTPLFSFKHLDDKLIKQIQAKDWFQIIFKIKKLESIKWGRIQADSYKNGHGCEYIKRKRLNFAIVTEFSDKEKFAVFRYTQKGRIIGYRDRRIFYILWIDPKHEAYQ